MIFISNKKIVQNKKISNKMLVEDRIFRLIVYILITLDLDVLIFDL